MELKELMAAVDELEKGIKGLTPATAQRASALNGLAHVRDNVRWHFESAIAAPTPPAKPEKK